MLGLGSAGNNIELNLIVDSRRDQQELKQWFNELWNDARLVQAVKTEVLDYHPSSFLKDDLPAAVREAYAVKIGNFNQAGRERILITMMKVNFLKRLGSSIDSFRLTLERTIKKIDDLKTKIDAFQQAEQSNPTYDFANLSDEDFDDLDLDPADLKIGGKHKINLGQSVPLSQHC